MRRTECEQWATNVQSRRPVKRIFKHLAFQLLGSAPVLRSRLERLSKSDKVVILNFHRVSPDDGSAYPPLHPDLFSHLLDFCADHFRLTCFSDLARPAPGDQRPIAIISFDDGYLDFVEFALPRLRRRGIPCNQNLIVDCLKSGLPPLNVQFQDFVGRASTSDLRAISISGFPRFREGEDRKAFGDRLSNFLKFKPVAQQRELTRASVEMIREVSSFQPTKMMTVADAKAIAGECEIGAHSVEHATLVAETPEYVEADARNCSDFFRTALGISPKIYALPNGSASEQQIRILEMSGYEHILCTGDDFSRADARRHPRFTMDGSSKAEVRFRATGFVRH